VTASGGNAPGRAGAEIGSGRALRLAHRGDWRRAPENTIAAFVAALSVPGCDGIEFDVRASGDGVAVCYHDDTLTRVHGVDRRVAELRASELEALGIPTLQRALTAIPRRAFLDIELKEVPGRSTFEAIIAGRGAALERALVSSFDPAALERIAGFASRWPRWLNAKEASPETLATARELGCRGIAVEWHSLDRDAVARAKAHGLDVLAWTVRRQATFRRLERDGVSAVCVEAGALDG
jgi:glycerophosphoryl diester phosphodiesterase